MHDQITAQPIRLDYGDFCALPDDGKRYEILDGALCMSPSPGTPHQRVSLRLARLLADHVEDRQLGEVFIAPFDVLLAEHDIVEPDLIFVATAREAIVTDKHIRGIPDLLIEIVSPSRPEVDVRDKRAVYARCGVPWYWLVAPTERRLTELELKGDAYRVNVESTGDSTFQSGLFTELQIDLTRLWA